MQDDNSESQLRIDFTQAKYLLGAAKLNQLPADTGIEVAFAGRSNAGKSSALNRLSENKGLARTSKTPGRTQLINIFTLDEHRRLVDLPGYGFAKVSRSVKQNWEKTLSDYLQTRSCLDALVILMDIRHPCKDMDVAMVRWALAAGLSVMVLLSKSDKVKQSVKAKSIRSVKQQLEELVPAGGELVISPFSSLKGEGVSNLRNFLLQRYKKGPGPVEPGQ